MPPRGIRVSGARFLIVAFVLFDLSAFDFTAADRGEVAGKGQNEMDRLVSCSGVARFLKSQPGLFRVRIAGVRAPNIGDAFQVQAVGGNGVTLTEDYAQGFRADLLNVRYIVKPAAATDAGAVYADAAWKVYEDTGAYPRAWLVHDTIVEPAPIELRKRLDAPGTDLHRVAFLAGRLDAALDPGTGTGAEFVRFDADGANGMDLSVRASGRGLLVLSEFDYPGWTATVNGRAARVWKVDGMLRGIVVPGGESSVSLRYRPASIFVGAGMTLAMFGGGLVMAVWFVVRRREKQGLIQPPIHADSRR